MTKLPKKPPTILYLIRHGEPEAQFLNHFYGQQDVTLGEKGKQQSQEVAQRLASVPFDAIYSSDLVRASYLADQLAKTRDLPVRRLEIFRERHLGVLQGMSIEELKSNNNEHYQKWVKDRVYYRVPEGESFKDVSDRIIPAMMELVEAFSGRRLVLVSHAGPMRVITAHALGLDLNHIFRIGVNHAGIHVIEFRHDTHPRVTLMNG